MDFIPAFRSLFEKVHLSHTARFLYLRLCLESSRLEGTVVLEGVGGSIGAALARRFGETSAAWSKALRELTEGAGMLRVIEDGVGVVRLVVKSWENWLGGLGFTEKSGKDAVTVGALYEESESPLDRKRRMARERQSRRRKAQSAQVDFLARSEPECATVTDGVTEGFVGGVTPSVTSVTGVTHGKEKDLPQGGEIFLSSKGGAARHTDRVTLRDFEAGGGALVTAETRRIAEEVGVDLQERIEHFRAKSEGAGTKSTRAGWPMLLVAWLRGTPSFMRKTSGSGGGARGGYVHPDYNLWGSTG